MLGKRQTNTDGFVNNDNDNDDDDTWGYSTVSTGSHSCKKCVAYTGTDRSSHQMGRRWRSSHTTRTMACLGTHARSTKDEARSASVDIPQSMSLRTSHILHAEFLQILVPRPQGARFYPQPRYASHGPGWGGEGYQMQAYPPPGEI